METKPFDWSQYFILAVELSNRPEEFAVRTAMSRAYYYVYHLALDRAILNGFEVKRGEGTHQQVWRTYNLSPDPTCRKLALIASRLKEKRERADYENFYVRLVEEIPQMLQEAEDFATRLQALPGRFPDPKSMRT
jgi:uncharacterized protein (UPF0332 family)